MSKKKFAWLHVGAWLLIYAYVILGIFYFPDSDAKRNSPLYMVVLSSSYITCHVITFYYCYLLIYPNLINRKWMIPAIVGFLCSPFVFVVVRYLIEETLFPVVFGFRNYGPGTTVEWYILDNMYRGLSVIAVSAVVWGARQAYAKEKENKQLREEKIKAELAFLKSQINPHFLYNTLNYIYSLAYPVSDKLADAIIRLSQLMRYMLTDTSDGMVDLQKEVDYIQNYVEIYRLRFEDAFFVDFNTDGNIAGKRISSLMLIPFVENAFKHGVVDDPQRPVKIQLKVTGNRLAFTVSNKISRGQKDHSSGIGLANIRRRLVLIYPNRHELLISENGQTYKTTLNIDL